MYKNIKISFLTVSLLVFCNVTFGQDTKTTKETDPLIKKVEVTKRYSPKIGNAIKYDISPGVVSRVKLDTPTFDYSIAYKPQTYAPKIYALKSFDIENMPIETIFNGYVDASIGIPLQSSLNAYYTTNPTSNLFFGSGINHYGFWGELDNSLGNSVESKETQSSVFATIDYENSNLQVLGDVKYSYNLYDMNGFSVPSLQSRPDAQNASNVVDLRVNVSTPHVVGDQWDYGLDFDGYYLSDNHDFHEMMMGFNAGIAKGFKNGKSRLSFNLEYIHYSSQTNDSKVGYANKTPKSSTSNIVFTPGYRIIGNNSILDISLGLNIKFGNRYGGKGSELAAVTPNISYEIGVGSVNFFAGIKSGYDYNSYNNLIKENPYLMSGQTEFDSYWTDIYAGLGGKISSWVSWSVEGGIKLHDNMIYFYNVLDGNTFAVDTKDGTETYGFLNTTLSALVTEKVTAHINYSYQSLDLYTYAKHNVDFGIICQITPKLQAKINGELMSSRDLASAYNSAIAPKLSRVNNPELYIITSVPTKIYLSVGAEYKLNSILSVTADVENILNSKMYKFNNYSGIGINAMIGITAKF